MNLKNIKLLVMDCDGVLSDGKVIYTESDYEAKSFSTKDGLGLSLLRFTDIKTAVITGRESKALTRRCNDLKVDFLYQGVKNKVRKVDDILSELSLDWENVAFIGDDWNDYRLLRKVGFAASPPHAPEEIKKSVKYVTKESGGNGAVREFVEHILREQGNLASAIESFLNHLDEN